VVLTFADGSQIEASAVIGADGIHSAVREGVFGKETPRYSGMTAYRSLVPLRRIANYDVGPFIKWWGPTQQSMLISFLINRGEDLYIFATRPEEAWSQESWSSQGDIRELRAAFAGYHRDVRDLLVECEEVLKTALYERDPLAHWTKGRITLLGDACHPM